MCVGVPVQVIEAGEGVALCRGPNGDEHINMLLIGDQPVGSWVLSHLGWGREVITEEDASNINKALQGLSAIMNGAEEIDVDYYFPGLATQPETN